MRAVAPPRLPLDQTALFLDFDGTLVEIAPQPELVQVAPELPALLLRLAEGLGGALALVSGRPIAEIDAFLAPARLPAAGAHGAEFRLDRDGLVETAGMPVPERLRRSIETIVRALAASAPGLRLEDKGTAIAVHYRHAPQAETPLRAALGALPLGAEWQLLPGHRVIEVKARGWDKGSAVERLMRTPAFAGRKPLFLGDDRTDLDGIAAAAKLGGGGIAVGGLASEIARWTLPDPAAVRAWLGTLLA
jgi:trehalose 6-phosphate phosphatase